MLKYIFYKTVTNLHKNLQAILIKNQARNILVKTSGIAKTLRNSVVML